MKEYSDIPKRIGFIAFPGMAEFDLSGPAKAFSAVQVDRGPRGYEIVVLAASMRSVLTDCGVSFTAHKTFKNAPSLDTIVIPGGLALREPEIVRPIADFVRERAPHVRRIVSLCSGLYALAATGILGGCRVTTHWRYVRDIAVRYPKLQVEENALFVRDGKIYTCAGSAAGIDLALHLIEEDYGTCVSLEIARDLILYLKRPGAQEQFSEPLQFQTTSVSRLSDLTTWILSHLHHDLSVERLAAKVCLCPRQFGRRFKSDVGITPAEFVENARLDEARRRLRDSDATIESVAASVGFHSGDVFRRRFEQKNGVTPTEFRRRVNRLRTNRDRDTKITGALQLAAA